MRAIDYLQSRNDILADKIGCTGNSGGGTLTAYLMALDDRIVAAARSTDVFRWSDYLSRYATNQKPLPIQLIATGEAAIPALHAAALEPSRFESVHLKRMIRSWAEVVAAPESVNPLVNSVHGALRQYHQPQLDLEQRRSRNRPERRRLDLE
jgi:hypothetical protein